MKIDNVPSRTFLILTVAFVMAPMVSNLNAAAEKGKRYGRGK